MAIERIIYVKTYLIIGIIRIWSRDRKQSRKTLKAISKL